jgi:aminopeptidase N
MSGNIVNLPPTSTTSAAGARTCSPMTLRGGGLFSTTTDTVDASEAASTSTAPVEIFRTDYKPLPYKVTNVNMNFIITDGKTTVHTELKIVPNDTYIGNEGGDEDMILNGEASALTLTSIQYNGVDLVLGTDFNIVGDTLLIPSRTLGNVGGVLTTSVDIVPETNTQLSGLYKSGKMYCTQCEAMG